jgi:hypothetical protein
MSFYNFTHVFVGSRVMYYSDADGDRILEYIMRGGKDNGGDKMTVDWSKTPSN